jgi:hypothetical protein
MQNEAERCMDGMQASFARAMTLLPPG